MATKRPCPSRGMYRRITDIATSSAQDIFKCLGTPLGSYAAGLLERGDFVGLLSIKVNPLTYTDVNEFRDDYLVSELMSKFPSWDLGIDRDQVAIDKFKEAEKVCLETNTRLKLNYGTPSTSVSLSSYLHMMKVKIEKLLGPFDWDQAEQHFGFGPGATTSLKRTHGDAYHKMAAFKPHVTRECMALAYTAVRRVPRWFAHLAGFTGELTEAIYEQLCEDVSPHDLFTIVSGNHVTTVPKSAKTNRVIAIEPDLNMFIQKGIGALIRRRLRFVGINLNDQTHNQVLAMAGSKDGTLATVDLSSASDTISLELVRQVMPPDWFSAIELCRSRSGTLPSGESIDYQKVSSMGNGFTFELESLIFWALVSVVSETHKAIDRRVAVYGDDLIFSSVLYEPVCELLSVCGFTVNAKKSFATGKFRESCGKHYFAGHDVTPFYIRKDVDSPDRLIWLANSIRRYSRKGFIWGLDGRFQLCYQAVVQLLPPFWRKPRITDNLGDIALFADFDEVLPQRLKHGEEGWQCMGVSERSFQTLPEDVPMLVKALYECERQPHGLSLFFNKGKLRVSTGGDAPLGVSIPKRRVTWRVVKPSTKQWENYGPWISEGVSYPIPPSILEELSDRWLVEAAFL